MHRRMKLKISKTKKKRKNRFRIIRHKRSMAFQCLNDWPSGLPHQKLFESLIYIEQDNANMNSLAEYVIKESWSLDIYVIDESWS